MQKKNKKIVVLLLVFLAVTQVVPTLAENISLSLNSLSESENQDSNEMSQPADSSDTEGSPSEDVEAETDEGSTAEIEDSESSATAGSAPRIQSRPPPPPHATENQWMFIQVPTSIRVDPRAVVTFLPKSTISSLTTMMMCISSATLKFDVGLQKIIDDVEKGYVLIRGDMTNSLIISGDSGAINNTLLTAGSFRFFTDTSTIGQRQAKFRFVDVSAPTLDESLCDDGRETNSRDVRIVPLGLSQSITKTQLDLGKRG